MLEFLPFNDELNRLRLVVTGISGDKAKVTWGDASREFSAQQLAKGINLAAEFLDNPFSEPFRAVEQTIARKQASEVFLIKSLLHNLSEYRILMPSEGESLERLAAGVVKRDEFLRKEDAAAVKPVRHVLKIEAQ